MSDVGAIAPARRIPRAALAVLVVASIVQLAVASLGPLDGDETLYWEWSRHLAWGYYDHPPGIALLIRIGVGLFGVTALGVRIVALGMNFAGALLVVLLALRHGGERVAIRAALIISCMPILTNWLMFATPDTALYLAEMAVLLLVDSALREAAGGGASLRWWLLAGVTLGFAALTKELAILLPAGIFGAFMTHPHLRRRLAEPGPYLACLVAGVMILPLVLWNRNHDWVLLQFVLQRGLGAEHGGAAGRELEFLGGQLAIVTPLLIVLLGVAVFHALRRPADPRRHLLAVMALVTFGAFALASLRHATEPNWVMMAYPPASILLAASSDDRVSRRWFRGALLLGGATVAVLYLHTAVRILPIAPLDDPIRRGHGWRELAARVDAARDVAGARAKWVAANRFQDASQLAFHLPGHPIVFSLNVESRANQYDLWPGFAQQAKSGDGLILVVDDVAGDIVARTLSRYFTQTTPGERVIAGGTEPELPAKRIWILEGWRGEWLPPPR